MPFPRLSDSSGGYKFGLLTPLSALINRMLPAHPNEEDCCFLICGWTGQNGSREVIKSLKYDYTFIVFMIKGK